MSIDKEVLKKIAHLARLEFDQQSEGKMLSDLNNMLKFVEKLQEIDTSGVKPLQSMTLEVNHVREDVRKVSLKRSNALRNAPKSDDEFFKVPKVIK